MRAAPLREGAGIALHALRSNRLRTLIAVVGIVVGVATTMLIGAVVGGMRASILAQVDAAGAENFAVWRFDPGEIRFQGTWDDMWGGNPRLTLEERDRLDALPSVEGAYALVYHDAVTVRMDAAEADRVFLFGQEAEWPRFSAGEFVQGRNFVRAEQARGAPVAVLSESLAEALVGDGVAVGRHVRIGEGGERFRVVGVYRNRPGPFDGDEGMETAWVPVGAALKRLEVKRDFLRIQVVPAAGATRARAVDDVTSALRAARGLRVSEPDDFVIRTNEQAADTFARYTGVFLLVMLVLSSGGLLVGGVGVVAVTTISVTERTREIGLRKAVGATRREILWQFLVEAVVLTVLGAALGLLLGGGGALLLRLVTPLPAAVPLGSVAAALAAAAVCGVGFGILPARRAARLDPVEALRHE